jgi:hypothetical protein
MLTPPAFDASLAASTEHREVAMPAKPKNKPRSAKATEAKAYDNRLYREYERGVIRRGKTPSCAKFISAGGI